MRVCCTCKLTFQIADRTLAYSTAYKQYNTQYASILSISFCTIGVRYLGQK